MADTVCGLSSYFFGRPRFGGASGLKSGRMTFNSKWLGSSRLVLLLVVIVCLVSETFVLLFFVWFTFCCRLITTVVLLFLTFDVFFSLFVNNSWSDPIFSCSSPTIVCNSSSSCGKSLFCNSFSSDLSSFS